MGITDLGKRLLLVNLGTACLATIEYLSYYYLFPSVIKANFASTELPDDPELAEPILLENESTKFVFKHRGGSKAVSSLVFDTFDNSRLMSRCVGSQLVSSFCLSYGLLSGVRHLQIPVCCLVLSNVCLLARPLLNAFDLHRLSVEVSRGQAYLYENLNEVRYVQMLKADESFLFRKAQFYGYCLGAVSIVYCAPMYGGLFTVAGIMKGVPYKYN
jgi:hypothetical protein